MPIKSPAELLIQEQATGEKGRRSPSPTGHIRWRDEEESGRLLDSVQSFDKNAPANAVQPRKPKPAIKKPESSSAKKDESKIQENGFLNKLRSGISNIFSYMVLQVKLAYDLVEDLLFKKKETSIVSNISDQHSKPKVSSVATTTVGSPTKFTDRKTTNKDKGQSRG